MKHLLFILTLLNCPFLLAQDKDLIFQFQVQKNDLISNYDLLISEDISKWEEVSDLEQIQFNPNYIAKENYKRKVLFKDIQSKKIYNQYQILKADFSVIDSLNQQTWSLVGGETEEILDYKCNKATTTFHGRDYEVFYTSEIPISNGPWKFGGLPGMILKVVATNDDETYKMECFGIGKHSRNLQEEWTDYTKENKLKKFKYWDDFVIDFEMFLIRYIKGIRSDMEADGDSGFSIHFSVDNYLEIFSEEVQTEGIVLEF